jgi:ADP-heptose:LPS heptosyltransferase
LFNPHFEFISLQKEVTDTERTGLDRADILHTGDALADFSDTAALCVLMDLVISVDTSVAHLAGALGIPVWVLLTWVPDWRWLLDRDDSPWYPSMRLFRQQARGDWNGVLERVELELTTLTPPGNSV